MIHMILILTAVLVLPSFGNALPRCREGLLIDQLAEEIKKDPGNNNRTGREYGLSMGTYRFMFEEWIENLKESDHVLEMGAGSGGLAKYIEFRSRYNKKVMPHVTLIDLFPIEDTYTRREFEANPRIHFLVGAAEKMKPADIKRPVTHYVDMYGALSYAGFYRKIWQLLSKVMMPKAQMMLATRLPIILDKNGEPLDFFDFFKNHVQGFRVLASDAVGKGSAGFWEAMMLKQGIKLEQPKSMGNSGQAYNMIVERTHEKFSMPKVKLVGVGPGRPPLRILQIQ